MSKIIFICHPIQIPSPKENVEKLLKIIRHINLTELDVIPIAPYLSDVLSLEEQTPEERQRGLANGHELIKAIWPYINECRLYGNRISPGMQAEKELFESLGVKVVDMTKPGIWDEGVTRNFNHYPEFDEDKKELAPERLQPGWKPRSKWIDRL